MKKRMDDLYNEIIRQTNRIENELNTDLLEIFYLFYDKIN
jgi:hypothetical protein